MNNVIQFPGRQRRRHLGVRVVPSGPCLDMFEVQTFEDGQWRAKTVASTEERAKELSTRFIVDRLFPDDDGGAAA